MIEIFKEESFLGTRFGIKENNVAVIPADHSSKESAIAEFEYWEKANIKKQFLPYIRTKEEVQEIVNQLKKA